jgi:microcystin-dependent protein
MAQPYVGEIRMFGGNFNPAGWMFCDGSLLPISEYETLFNLIGTTYGGDGQSTFALPDLRGRLPVHFSSTTIPGENGGVESVTLSVNQIPAHPHAMMASTTTAGGSTPQGNLTGQVGAVQIYREAPPAVVMSPNCVTPTGGSQAHSNFQPYLCISFIISLFGIFPSQT